ncbi:MAG: MFS transporter [Promethearchaeota archaeon]|nr:MAG: MFS transporter [Candidatus Lokiarchaeota archaeon]
MSELEKTKENNMIFGANIKKSYLASFFRGFHFISGVLLPFFLGWGKLTFVEVMLLQSYFTIMIVAFEIPCGAISDYISRKFSLFLGALAMALAALIYSSMPNILLFVMGETLFALGFALISGADEAFIFDTLRKMNREIDMPKIMARIRSFFLAGIGIAAPIGSIITLFYPLNYAMTFMFFPFIIASLITLSFREPNHELERESIKYLSIVQSGFRELKKNKTLRILAFDFALVDVLVFLLIWTYQLYLDAVSVPLVYFGFIAASMTLTQVIFFNLVPKLQLRFKNKKFFLTIYTMIPGISYILIAFIIFPPIGIVLILIIIGIGFSRNIIFIGGINKNIEEENRATVLSTISMIRSFIITILYPLIGLLAMWNLHYTFIILGISIILISILSRVKNEYL